MTFQSTMTEQYEEPARFKLEIFSPDESTLLYEYDPVTNINTVPFLLQRVQVREPGLNTPGAFEFALKSTKRYPWNVRNIPSGAAITISSVRLDGETEKLIQGFIDVRAMNVRRQFYAMDIFYSGLGVGHINSHSLISFRKQPAVINEVLNNPEFRIPVLMNEAMTSSDVLPLDTLLPIAQRGNYDLSEVLPGEVMEFLGGVDYTGTMAGLLDIFAQSSGSAVVVDGNRKVKMRYPNSVHSGHVIKPFLGPELAALDDGDWTSYYMPPLSWSDTIAFDSGCVQAVKLIISNQNVVLSGPQEVNKNYLELANQDIVIQFEPSTTLLQDIAFVLSKTGTGHSDIETALGLDSLVGYVVTDKNNEPHKKLIASFKIPYSSISDAPNVVTNVQLQWLVGNLNVENKHWLYLAHSGIESDNTVRVHTDGDTSTVSTDDVIRRIGIKSPPTNKVDLVGNQFWKGFNYSNSGPVPLFNFFANQETSLYVMNSQAERLFAPNRPREIQINAPFVRDLKTGYQYAEAYLNFASKRKVMFNDTEITLPRKWIHPLEMVDLVLPEYGYTEASPLTVEISSTMVEAMTSNLTKPLGFDTIHLSMLGYEDPGSEFVTGSAVGVCMDC